MRPFQVPRPCTRLAAAALLSVAACGGKTGDAPPPPKKAAAQARSFDTALDPAATLGTVPRLAVAVSPEDPARGAEAPLVTVVLFSDFECPFCAKLATTLETVLPEYEANVRLVFKHYPLPNHPNAEPAAKAAVAAHKQGKFWEMHDLIFAQQSALSPRDLLGHARTLGLDIEAYTRDTASKASTVVVNNQFADGRVLEVGTTPSLFVNGRLVKGAKSAAELSAILDEEVAVANELVAGGIARADLYATVLANSAPGKGKRPNRDPTHRRGEASKRTNYAISVADFNPARGADDALVTIVEYGAFGCPECASMKPHLDALLAKYPTDLRVVWRNFPGDSGTALNAAKAGAAAHMQGKFWPLYEAMLGNDATLTPDNLTALAVKAGAKKAAFVKDLDGEAVSRQIRIDQATANKVRGTAPAPFLWVNGRIVDSRDKPGLADIDALVVEEKAKAEAYIAEHGTARAGLYDAMRQTWRGAALIDKAAEG